MSEMLISDQTSQRINAIASRQPQSLIIEGQVGSGKTTVALKLITTFLEKNDSKSVQNYPYVKILAPSAKGGAIKIEQIRDIKSFLTLKLPGSEGGLRRFLVIESASSMTVEAQNAALKFIEEPPENTLIILLVENRNDLLATIRSRCMVLRISAPSLSEAKAYFKNNTLDLSDLEKNYRLSGGQVGLLLHLTNSNDDHELAVALSDAKEILRAAQFERLASIDKYTKDKIAARNLLFALNKIASAGLQQAATKDNAISVKRWHAILSQLNESEKYLSANVNAKLVFTKLMLAL